MDATEADAPRDALKALALRVAAVCDELDQLAEDLDATEEAADNLQKILSVRAIATAAAAAADVR